ncbi:organic cation transporter protein-like [Choristoneura fumiferana]|uniref:organic cation transporter protein-like n=1 Tax=Choristoneura fumiferana TaxID=7141 RepID=UPI003D154E45
MAVIYLVPPVSYTCPNNTTCCDDPTFDTSVFKRTIATEFHLICDKSWLQSFFQTLFQSGVMAGSLMFGIASDRYGRRPAVIVAVMLELCTGIIAAFMTGYWSFTFVRMITGAATGGIMVVTFVLLMEFIGTDKRSMFSAIFHVPFAMGHMSLPLFAYFYRDYVQFQFAISVANVIVLIYICLLPESPRWLLAMNKVNEVVTILTKVAIINKMPTDTIRQAVEQYHINYHVSSIPKGSVADLFRTSNLRRNIVVMSFTWFACSFSFFGMAQYVSYLTGDIFLNVFASGAVCFCACLVAIPMLTFMKRKKAVAICNATCGVCLLIIAFIPDGILGMVFACLGMLLNFLVFIIIYLYCTEMFPTVVRNAALGFSSMMARVGSMIAPFVVALKPHGQWCAPVLFGVLPLISAVLCLMLPETKDIRLMTTLEEGEAIGQSSRKIGTK